MNNVNKQNINIEQINAGMGKSMTKQRNHMQSLGNAAEVREHSCKWNYL
jgi:hypothetical protein